MATFTAIPERTQSATAMKKVLQYVMQEKKTLYQDEATGQTYQLISGQHCMAETAFKEFMNTKKQYKKDSGVFFKQYVQSFQPNCGATPEQIHAIGIETARAFGNFEVVVATHIDTDHWHNHFIVNSVNYKTGRKIQINEKGLESLRTKSDEISKAHGMEILKPYQKPGKQAVGQREYRAAARGQSWKFRLMACIDKAMDTSNGKAGFIQRMREMGYEVKWQKHLKYITYTTSDGKKCRDNKLHDEKYFKNRMEEFFEYKSGRTQSQEQSRKLDERLSNQSPVLWDTPDRVGTTKRLTNSDYSGASPYAGANQQIAHMGRYTGDTNAHASDNDTQAGGSDQRQRETSHMGDETPDKRPTNISEPVDRTQDLGAVTNTQSAGLNAVEAAPEMGGSGGRLATDLVGTALDLTVLLDQSDEEQKGQASESKRISRKKKKSHTYEKDWDMTF